MSEELWLTELETLRKIIKKQEDLIALLEQQLKVSRALWGKDSSNRVTSIED